MRRLALLSVIGVVAAACATTGARSSSSPAPKAAPSGPAPAAPPAPAGSIGVTCQAIRSEHNDYAIAVTVGEVETCAVDEDKMLTLAVKGPTGDRVQLFLTGYHGSGSYPLSGDSYLALSGSFRSEGRSQTTQGCTLGTCSAVVTDAAAAGGGQHTLDVAVTCPKLCDGDTHQCTTAPGGGGNVTWSFKTPCLVR